MDKQGHTQQQGQNACISPSLRKPGLSPFPQGLFKFPGLSP